MAKSDKKQTTPDTLQQMEKEPTFVSKYANNVRFEATVHDLKIVFGEVMMLGFDQLGTGIRWEYKLGVFLIPVLAYGIMMLGRPFPKVLRRFQRGFLHNG